MDEQVKRAVTVQKIARIWLACRKRDALMWDAFNEEQERQQRKDQARVQETFELVQRDQLQQQASETDMIEKHRAYVAKTAAQNRWKMVRSKLNTIAKLKSTVALSASLRQSRAASPAKPTQSKMALAPAAVPPREYSTEERAACIRIQQVWRVCRSKIRFLNLLVALAKKHEEDMRAKDQAQVEETYRLLEAQEMKRAQSDRAMLISAKKRRESLTAGSLQQDVQRAQSDCADATTTPLHCELGESKAVRTDGPSGSHVTTFAVGVGTSAKLDTPKVRTLTAAEIATLTQAKATLERAGLTSDARYKKIVHLMNIAKCSPTDLTGCS